MKFGFAFYVMRSLYKKIEHTFDKSKASCYYEETEQMFVFKTDMHLSMKIAVLMEDWELGGENYATVVY